MRTYWKIRINHSRLPWKFQGYDVYFWTDKPLTPERVAAEAVCQKMIIDVEQHIIDRVHLITKEEYYTYMNE